MDLLGKVKKLLGVKPVSVSELNRRVTAVPESSPAIAPTSPPLPPKPAPVRDPLKDIGISPEYRAVRSRIEAGDPVIFVTGNAGTGKTTLIRYYLRHVFRERNVAVLAFTGVAALNADGVTIHSFFLWRPKKEHEIKLVTDRGKLYEKLDLLIIDEISMVRCDLLDNVDKFLRKNRYSDEPFGGVQLVLVGDLHQLPPVVPRQERQILEAAGYEGGCFHFFKASSLQSGSLTPIELTSVYRQKEEGFVRLLNKLRIGEDVEPVVAELNKRCFPCGDFRPDITLTCTNRVADEINERELGKLPSRMRSFKGSVQGRFNLQEDKLPSPLDLRLKVGSRVMFTKNDGQGRRWVNGTLGTVAGFSGNSIRVKIRESPRDVVYDVLPVVWEAHEYAYDEEQGRIVARVIGAYTQYPLMLAWAVTVYKAQGKTFDKVLIDLGEGAFAPGQVYVALSRCRSLEGIRLRRPLRISDVKCDPTVTRFYEALDLLAGSDEYEEDMPPVPTDDEVDEDPALH